MRLVALWAATLALAGLGSWCWMDVLRSPNPCKMSYMAPRYFPVAVPDSDETSYQLFEYRDQRQQKYVKSGHVVLFIPGHGGSYGQVRSLGGALVDTPLDVFALDFREEPSSFLPWSLRAQARFFVQSLKVLEQVYRESGTEMQSLQLVAHSMGGWVVRIGLAMDPVAEEIPLRSIITLSTSHAWVPVRLDADMQALVVWSRARWRCVLLMSGLGEQSRGAIESISPWYSVNHYDIAGTGVTLTRGTCVGESHTCLRNVAVTKHVTSSLFSVKQITLLSIGSGARDSLVWEPSTVWLPSDVDADIGAWWSTTTMESLRFGVDHNAILWCRQLVREVKNVIVETARHCNNKQPCHAVANETRLPSTEESWSVYSAADLALPRPWAAMIAALPLRWGPSVLSSMFQFAAWGHLWNAWGSMSTTDAPSTMTILSVFIAMLASGVVQMVIGFSAPVDPNEPMDSVRVHLLAWLDFGDDVRFFQSFSHWDAVGVVGIALSGWTLYSTLVWACHGRGDEPMRHERFFLVPCGIVVVLSLVGQSLFPGATLFSITWNLARMLAVVILGWASATRPHRASSAAEIVLGIAWLSMTLPWCIDGVFRIPEIGLAYLLLTQLRAMIGYHTGDSVRGSLKKER